MTSTVHQLDSDWLMTEARRLSNAGRWGDRDEFGTWNCVDAAKIAQAISCAVKHQVFSLSLPFGLNGPNCAAAEGPLGRSDPMHFMTMTGTDLMAADPSRVPSLGFADDWVVMNLSCSTHWDGFAHAFHEGSTYNDMSAREVTSRKGAARGSIAALKGRCITRAVLVDVARLVGVDWLPAGFSISPEHLDAACAENGVVVGAGDVVLVRTGALAEVRRRGSWQGYASDGPHAGIGARCAAWFAERDVAAVATDTWHAEVLPYETAGSAAPLHQILLARCGITIGEMFDLEELAEDCARDGVYTSLFIAPPLPITGAVNSPVNPVAVK